MTRYVGRPLYKLLECYVLYSIGHLTENQKNILVGMEPKLREVYSINGSWLDIISHQMDFPSTLPEQIRKIWMGYVKHVQQQGLEPDPVQFSLQFVDENFPDI